MKKLALLSLLFLTLFACRNDKDETLSTVETVNPPITTILDYNPENDPVTATVFGSVIDENGNPVVGASVKMNTNTETTDADGHFVIKEVTMNAKGTFIQVNQNGHFPGSFRFFPKEGSVNYANITLLAKTNTGSFVSNEGGVISSTEGIQLDFPANSVVTSNGDVYEGTVEVSARWLDPTADDVQAIMPGALQGINENAEEVALASFGMMAVELESPSGSPLNLGNDLKAILSFPVPAAMISDAPAEIPLWYFNETYGLWVEEGTATLQGDQYVGEVAHFSFWNCDYPYPLVEFSGTLLSDNGNPIANAWVNLMPTSGGYSACGLTDDNGVFSGKVPQNEEFVMTISQYESCDIYTQNVGPFADDTDIGIITVSPSELLDITGTLVDCNGDALTNGWIKITLGGASYTYYTVDGSFNTAIYNCSNETELTVTAINLDDLEQSDVLVYTVVDPLDLGSISACGNALSEYLTIDVDGVTTTFVNVSTAFYLDSTFVSGYEVVSGGDYNVFLGLNEITTTGTYPESIVQSLSMFVPYGSGSAIMNCNNFNGTNLCGIDEVVITTLGNVGEEVIGTFSGTSDFIDNMTQQTVTLSYSASFKIIRE